MADRDVVRGKAVKLFEFFDRGFVIEGDLTKRVALFDSVEGGVASSGLEKGDHGLKRAF